MAKSRISWDNATDEVKKERASKGQTRYVAECVPLYDTNGNVVYEGEERLRRKVVHSYQYGIDEPPKYPKNTKARELADALDRILRWTNLAAKLPNEFWMFDFHKNQEEGDVWKAPEVTLSEAIRKMLEKPKVWKAPVFQLPESDEKVVLPMVRKASEEPAKQLRKVTLLKAIRAIGEKPKVSFVPLFANLRLLTFT